MNVYPQEVSARNMYIHVPTYKYVQNNQCLIKCGFITVIANSNINSSKAQSKNTYHSERFQISFPPIYADKTKQSIRSVTCIENCSRNLPLAFLWPKNER